MSTNLNLWNRLGKTDPAHTKPFQRSGGFKGTSIKPIYSYHRMTDEFGPCGTGWGINAPAFQVVAGPDGEQLVFCTVSIWYGVREQIVYGVGGDKAVVKQSSGIRSDDEAFKKAFTDGITNALKMIGVGADVHMGMFDDDKYVNSLNAEFALAESGEKNKPPPVTMLERNSFMVECRDTIAQFSDAEVLLTWWNSDAQKKARREYELDASQVETLKTAVMDRRKALESKAKAA